MSEIIDIITVQRDKSQYFTVNNAAAAGYIDLLEPAAPDYTLSNPIGRKRFREGDAFSILSSGIIIPEFFQVWKQADLIGLQPLLINKLLLKGLSGVYYKIDVLGTDSDYYLPMENYELSLDIFVDLPKQLSPAGVPCTEAFNLLTYKSDALISMQMVPAAYNGKKFLFSPFFKILHNFPMY